MKKILTTLVITSFLFTSGSGCILFNMLGLNPGHERGAIAAARIQEAAILMNMISYTAFYGVPYVDLLSILADQIAGIKPEAYYKTKDVDACVEAIWGLWGFLGVIFTGGFAVAVESECRLEPDNIIIDL